METMKFRDMLVQSISELEEQSKVNPEISQEDLANIVDLLENYDIIYHMFDVTCYDLLSSKEKFLSMFPEEEAPILSIGDRVDIKSFHSYVDIPRAGFAPHQAGLDFIGDAYHISLYAVAVASALYASLEGIENLLTYSNSAHFGVEFITAFELDAKPARAIYAFDLEHVDVDDKSTHYAIVKDVKTFDKVDTYFSNNEKINELIELMARFASSSKVEVDETMTLTKRHEFIGLAQTLGLVEFVDQEA